MASRFIVGLDIGTAAIKVTVAENRGGRPILRAIFKESAIGLRKGAIADIALVSGAIARALGEAKKIAKPAVKNVYVNIGTHQVKAQHSHGIVAVSRADNEIYEDDIERVTKASQAVHLAPNRMVIHNVTREFIVDGVPDINDPLGLSGNRLEVMSLIVDAFAPHVKSVMRAVELAGGRIGGMVFDPLSGSRSTLSKVQKELGVVLIDIGFGTTAMSIYHENKLSGVAIFPVGAGNITNDLAVGLRIPVEVAENLKLHYGYAVAREMSSKEAVDLQKFSPETKGSVSRRYIAEIIEPRLAEIFEFVNNEIKSLGKAGQLAGGAVLVGGGAKLPGMTELARQELKLSTQIGSSMNDAWASPSTAFSEVFEDPEYVNVLGLALWGFDRGGWQATGAGLTSRMKNILRYFLP